MRILPLVLSSVLTLAIGLLIGMEISGDSTEAREPDVPVASGGRVSASRSTGKSVLLGLGIVGQLLEVD